MATTITFTMYGHTYNSDNLVIQRKFQHSILPRGSWAGAFSPQKHVEACLKQPNERPHPL